MYSLGLVAVNQSKPLGFAPGAFPFEVDARLGVVSHRGEDPPFGPVFRGMAGCTYHIGHWHNEGYFSAWEWLDSIAEPKDGRTRVRLRDLYRPPVEVLLETLIKASPDQKVFMFIDKQGLPKKVNREGPLTSPALWLAHDREGLASGWLYEITPIPGVYRSEV